MPDSAILQPPIGDGWQMGISALWQVEGLFHLACLARVVSRLALVFAIFMAHENEENKGNLGDSKCKECWMKQREWREAEVAS